MFMRRIVLFLLGIGSGFLLGSILALLYAPQAGVETRADIEIGVQEATAEAGRRLKNVEMSTRKQHPTTRTQ